MHLSVSLLLIFLLVKIVDILDSSINFLIDLSILSSSYIIPMPSTKYMLKIIFKSLFAYCTEQMIWAWTRLFNNNRILFFMSLFSVQIFKIFIMLFSEKVELLLRILPFISKWKKRSAKRCVLVEIGIIILSNMKSAAEESFQRILSWW